MKARRLLIISAALVGVITVCALLLQSHSLSATNGASIYLKGYTNTAGVDMAVIVVTNHTETQFECLVGPRESEASQGSRPLFRSTSAPAAQGTLPPLGVFEFSVPSSSDTNLWRVSVKLQESTVNLPTSRRLIIGLLHEVGLHGLDPEIHHLTSPAFSSDQK
jgi:hypothetical protein